MAITEKNQTAGIPLTDCEKRIWSDIKWADDNPELQAKYAGEWVAVYQRAVLAHGKDRAEVLRQGAEAALRPSEEIAVWPIFEAASILSDAPSGVCEF